MNRIIPVLEDLDDAGHPNPGTPDDWVSLQRRMGRTAARDGRPVGANPFPGAGRVDWYLGWYDVRLRRFYL
jgi:hypothetical protein